MEIFTSRPWGTMLIRPLTDPKGGTRHNGLVTESENRGRAWGDRRRNWENKSLSESQNVHMEKVRFRGLEKNICAKKKKKRNVPTEYLSATVAQQRYYIIFTYLYL